MPTDESRVKQPTRRDAVRLLGAGAGLGMLARLGEQAGLAAQGPSVRAGRVTFPKGAIIRTVLEDVPPELLGKGATLFHEHISLSDPLPPWRPPPKAPVTPYGADIELMINELNATAKDGVSCIVNAGTKDLGYSITNLRAIAARTAVHIVAAGPLLSATARAFR